MDHDGDSDVDYDDIDLFIANACGPEILPDPLCGQGESFLAGGVSGGLESSTEDGLESGSLDSTSGTETLGLASAVRIDVLSNPFPGPYVNSRTEAVGFDQAFVVWTQVVADGDMDGVQYRLRVNGGADDDQFRLIGYAEGPLSVFHASLDGLGELFSLAGPPEGFGTGDYARLTPPVTLDAVATDEIVFNFSQFVAAEAFPGTLVGYVLEPAAPLEAGDYVFTAGGSAATGDVAVWAASPASGETGGNQAFTLTVQ